MSLHAIDAKFRTRAHTITTSAPIDFTRSSLDVPSGVLFADAVQATCAPTLLASWIAKRPVPEDPPNTSSFCPALRSPIGPPVVEAPPPVNRAW